MKPPRSDHGVAEATGAQLVRVLINAIHSRAGGGRTYLEAVAPRLARERDLEALVVCTPEQGVWLRPQGVSVRVVNPPAGRMGRHLWTQLVIPRIAREVGADVVYTPANYGPLQCGVRSQLLMRNTPAAAEVCSRGTAALSSRLEEVLSRAALRQARGAMVVSASFRKYLVERWGIPESWLQIVHHGVADHFNPGPAGELQRQCAPYFLMVSTLRPQKNIEAAIDALEAARAMVGEANLVVIGSRPDPRYAGGLFHRARARGLGTSVRFLEVLPGRELTAWYRGAVGVLCISLAETFGMSQLEAMACGAPVIASDLDYAQEVCQGAAIYVPPRDVRAIADAMVLLIRDRVLRDALTQQGLRRAQAFSWKETVSKVAQILRERARLSTGNGKVVRRT